MKGNTENCTLAPLDEETNDCVGSRTIRWSRSSLSSVGTFDEAGEHPKCDSEEQEEEDEEEQDEGPQGEIPTSAAGGQGASDGQQGAPEGGWGWVVLLATILVMALTLAFPCCIGIFYMDLQTDFEASNTETSWVPSIMTAVLHAGGPICSVLVEQCGCRVTVMMGGVLSGLGMAASSFTRTITELYITAGVITGLGFCFCFQPAITIMGHYFVRRRAFANALSSTGTAIGLSTLPLLANYLLSQLGWRGSFLVLGGVLLNCCVCGAVMRPVKGTPSPETSPRPNGHAHPALGLKERVQETRGALGVFLRRHMAFDLLCNNRRYRAYVVGATWAMLGFMVPLVYLVPYATSQGIAQGQAALLLALLGLVNILARPLAALLFGLPCFRSRCAFVYVFAVALLANGLSNCVCCVAASFPVLLAYVLLFGLSMSVVGSLLFTVLMETVEMSRFPAALGLLTIMESVTLLVGPPLVGFLVDRTGRYTYVFYACAATVASAALFLMCCFYWLDREEGRAGTLRPSEAGGCRDCRYSGVSTKVEMEVKPGM